MAPQPISESEVALSIVSGVDQTGDPGVELTEPLVVLVTDDRGHALRDHVVNFTVVEGGGRVFAGAATTDRQGVAADWWTLGPRGAQVIEVRTVSSDGSKHTHAEFRATLNFEEELPEPEPIDLDGDGYTVAEGDCDVTDAAVNPGAEDRPDGSFLDSNCDDIDGDIELSVFVSTAGADVGNCGGMLSPCLTIQAGLAQAAAAGRPDVLVARGGYDEAVSLIGGVNLYGGYSRGFTDRNALVYEVVITGGSGQHGFNAGREPISVLADRIREPTEVADLTIVGIDASGTLSGDGRNSYALLVYGVAAELLTITRTRIVAGNGSRGADGADGRDANHFPADDGQRGADEVRTFFVCNSAYSPGGNGGLFGTDGGDGGSGGSMDTSCGGPLGTADNANARTGTPGITGAALLGIGAPGGAGGFGGNVCSAGAPGGAGGSQNGSPGNGGSDGAVASVYWRSDAGGAGTLGFYGGGGGGGGGAGGCDQGNDSRGASGGGGGAGGERAAAAGRGGRGGGSSFAVYVIQASPSLVANQLVRGSGGAGGNGGMGALGQPGGHGGAGGSPINSGPAGRGGDGGDGGDAGAGGGGAGGISVAIASIDGGTPFVSGNVILGGSGGLGGVGGPPGGGPDADGGLPGGNGETGALLEELTL